MIDHDALEELRQLKARYCRLIDTKRWDELRDVLTEDFELTHPAEGVHGLTGRDKVVHVVSRFLDDVVTVHQVHMPELRLLDADHAHGSWSMTDKLVFGAAHRNGRSIVEGHGFYVEDYRREDGVWRIAKSHLHRLHLATDTHHRDPDEPGLWP